MTFIITDGEDVIAVLKERPEFVSADFALIEVGSHRIGDLPVTVSTLWTKKDTSS